MKFHPHPWRAHGLRLALAALVLGPLVAPWSVAHAEILFKTKNGDWFDGQQWSPFGPPLAADDAFVESSTEIVGASAAAKLVYLTSALTIGSDGTLSTRSNFHLGPYFDGGGSLRIDGNTNTVLSIGNSLMIGSGSAGTVEIDAGTVSVTNGVFVGGGAFVNEFAVELQARRSEDPDYEPPDAFGSLTIRGADSSMFAPSFRVGSEASFGSQGQTGLRATGTVRVTDGGELVTGFGLSIFASTSIISRPGSVTIEGDDSLWRANSLRVDGALLVAAGGKVQSNGLASVGRNPRRDIAGHIDVDGAGSLLEVVTGELAVDGVVVARRGGEVRAFSARLNAGEFEDVQGGTLRVEAGSALRVQTYLDLEANVSDDTLLSIDAGGLVSAAELTLSRNSGNHGHFATIRALGPDATLQVSGATSIGRGRGGVLEVLGGARALLADVGVGESPSGFGGSGRLLVDGEGSRATASTRWNVGTAGKGVVTLAEGGTLAGQVVNLGGVVAPGFDGEGTLNIGGAVDTGPRRAGGVDLIDDINIAQSGLVVFNHLNDAYQFNTRLESTVFRAGRLEQRFGTTLLAGDQTHYTGAVHVMGGTLLVNTALGAPVVEVDAGATLGGSGFVNDILAHAGAIIAPGNSPGVLTVAGDLRMAPGAMLRLEVFGDTPGVEHDVLEVTGDVDVGSAIIELVFGNGFAPRADQTLDLLRVGGLFTGLPAVQVSGLEAGWLFDLGFDAAIGQLVLTSRSDGVATTLPSPVPLPAPWALLVAALVRLGARSRSRH